MAPTLLFADELLVDLVYLEQKIDRPPNKSTLIVWPEDDGVQGALLGIEDNNTTGKFLKQKYTLNALHTTESSETVTAAKEALGVGAVILILNVPADVLLQIADLPEAQDDLIFNARSQDNRLRSDDCRANVFHTMPSRKMLTDSLMQFMVKRRWDELFLIEGGREADQLLAASYRDSAKKFGLDIVVDKQWLVDADIRRNAAQEVPVFTQYKKYDAVVVADEDQDFGHYLLYNTWLGRPVSGNAGLTPVVWSRVVEQWGALQLQSRFMELSGRDMTGVDYANWAAVRSVGEAVTRTKSANPGDIKNYMLTDKFTLAGFKGQPLSYRTWNGQLRQGTPLVHAFAVVANAPLEGFLHQRTELDTIGYDEPDSGCSQF